LASIFLLISVFTNVRILLLNKTGIKKAISNNIARLMAVNFRTFFISLDGVLPAKSTKDLIVMQKAAGTVKLECIL
jgi:hypothetical protein